MEGKFILEILGMINHKELEDILVDKWQREGKTSLAKWEILKREVNLYLKNLKQKNTVLEHKLKFLEKEIILSYLYPRLDVRVSMEINHLLKSPFCVHPKTGNVCVPFYSDEIDDFNPFTVPTLKKLIHEFGSEDAKNTTLYPYIQKFEKFVKTCQTKDKLASSLKKQREGKMEMEF